ncbi:hypothetical protein D8S78_05110 [Natrialba swarupiae]|nr:hypothetical protein [Natrialba swarupiae]
MDGDGDGEPYVITNASELQAIAGDLEADYVLGDDVDASDAGRSSRSVTPSARSRERSTATDTGSSAPRSMGAPTTSACSPVSRMQPSAISRSTTPIWSSTAATSGSITSVSWPEPRATRRSTNSG